MKKTKQVEVTSELFLDQGLRELLYAFRKNGGDLDYCIKLVRDDFKKAGYFRFNNREGDETK